MKVKGTTARRSMDATNVVALFHVLTLPSLLASHDRSDLSQHTGKTVKSQCWCMIPLRGPAGHTFGLRDCSCKCQVSVYVLLIFVHYLLAHFSRIYIHYPHTGTGIPPNGCHADTIHTFATQDFLPNLSMFLCSFVGKLGTELGHWHSYSYFYFA